MTVRLASPPALLIRLELEAAPRLQLVAENLEGELRLFDWLRHPALARLLALAADARRELDKREAA